MLSQLERRVVGLSNTSAAQAADALGIPVHELRRIRRRLGQEDELPGIDGLRQVVRDAAGDSPRARRDASRGPDRSIERMMRERSSVCG